MHLKDFNELKKNLRKDFAKLKIVKVALLGDSATQLLAQAIKGYGYEFQINFDIYEADYNQIESQIFDTTSKLYQFSPDYIIIFHSVQKIIRKFYSLSSKKRLKFADDHIKYVSYIYSAITSNLLCKVLYLNFSETNDYIFGNYCNKVEISWLYQVRKINYRLMNLCQEHRNLFIVDLSSLQNIHGNNFVSDSKIYVGSDIVFSLDFIPIIAKNITDIAMSIMGKFRKCLILDLDNVLWGGVIGDDGMDGIQIGDLGIGKAFTEIQLWAKQLKERGIVLAVCSKNDENIAKEPFLKHPDMMLRLDDFALFVANWGSKVDNIQHIQRTLNIGFDSIVFLDDSPFERSLVINNIPDISVPELPEDPADYLNFIRTLNLFETASFTEEDKKRTLQYRQEAHRAVALKLFDNKDDFLASLCMTSVVKPFDKFNIPRVVQLIQRSNQFNLRTVRYSEKEIQDIASSNSYFTFSFTLRDKFGDYGLISVLILRKQPDSLFIDTWIMSCRVLQRGMENFVLNKVVGYARKNGYVRLIGEYMPTAKNGIVKDHYKNLGFTCFQNGWILDLKEHKKIKNFIKTRMNK